MHAETVQSLWNPPSTFFYGDRPIVKKPKKPHVDVIILRW